MITIGGGDAEKADYAQDLNQFDQDKLADVVGVEQTSEVFNNMTVDGSQKWVDQKIAGYDEQIAGKNMEISDTRTQQRSDLNDALNAHNKTLAGIDEQIKARGQEHDSTLNGLERGYNDTLERINAKEKADLSGNTNAKQAEQSKFARELGAWAEGREAEIEKEAKEN